MELAARKRLKPRRHRTDTAEAVLRGMQRRGFEIHFPRRFTWVMKLVRALPYALSLRLLRRLG